MDVPSLCVLFGSHGCNEDIVINCCSFYLFMQMTGRYVEYAEELSKAVRNDFTPKIVKE